MTDAAPSHGRGTTRRRKPYARRLSPEARREQLLDAALRVLVRDGFDQVTIEAIAQEAGVTRPVVYSAYGGLGPLLHALLDRSEQRGLEQALTLLPPDGVPADVDAWLADAAGRMIDLVQADPDTWRPILGLVGPAPAVVRERISVTEELVRVQVARAIRAGLDARGGPDLDADILSHLAVATAEQFGRLALERPDEYPRERLVEALGTLLRLVPVRG